MVKSKVITSMGLVLITSVILVGCEPSAKDIANEKRKTMAIVPTYEYDIAHPTNVKDGLKDDEIIENMVSEILGSKKATNYRETGVNLQQGSYVYKAVKDTVIKDNDVYIDDIPRVTSKQIAVINASSESQNIKGLDTATAFTEWSSESDEIKEKMDAESTKLEKDAIKKIYEESLEVNKGGSIDDSANWDEEGNKIEDKVQTEAERVKEAKELKEREKRAKKLVDKIKYYKDANMIKDYEEAEEKYYKAFANDKDVKEALEDRKNKKPKNKD